MLAQNTSQVDYLKEALLQNYYFTSLQYTIVLIKNDRAFLLIQSTRFLISSTFSA